MIYSFKATLSYSESFFLSITEELLNTLCFKPSKYELSGHLVSRNKTHLYSHTNFLNALKTNIIDKGYLELCVLGTSELLRINFHVHDETIDYEKPMIPPEGNTFTLEWLISDINTLLDSELFRKLTTSEYLILALCYNATDAGNQSFTNYTKETIHTAPKGVVLKSDKYGGVYGDISSNWGRILSSYRLPFIAASKMWFGKIYNDVIMDLNLLNSNDAPKNTLERLSILFKSALRIKPTTIKLLKGVNDITYVELFDLNVDMNTVRDIQKKYIKIIQDNKIIERHDKSNALLEEKYKYFHSAVEAERRKRRYQKK